jgi:hypothetical protein
MSTSNITHEKYMLIYMWMISRYAVYHRGPRYIILYKS